MLYSIMNTKERENISAMQSGKKLILNQKMEERDPFKAKEQRKKNTFQNIFHQFSLYSDFLRPKIMFI